MLGAGPAGHVRTDLCDESQGGIGPDGVDLCDVRTGKSVERAADFDARLVLVPLPPTRLGQRGPWNAVLGGQVLKEGFDLVIAGADLTLMAVVELEILSQHKDVFPSRYIPDRFFLIEVNDLHRSGP